MRRRILKVLPRLTHFYGLTPADIDAMTPREVSEYVVQMDEYQRAQEEAAKRNGG